MSDMPLHVTPTAAQSPASTVTDTPTARDGECPRCGESTDGQPGYAGCTDPSCPVG